MSELKKYAIEVTGTFSAYAEVMANSQEEAEQKYYDELDIDKDFDFDFDRNWVEIWEY